MDKLTVSLEVAEQLNEAAWVPITAFYWGRWPKQPDWFVLYGEEVDSNSEKDGGFEFINAPTASEIMKVLPVHTTIVKGDGRYVVIDYPTQAQAIAPTMADALAELWIKLKETNRE